MHEPLLCSSGPVFASNRGQSRCVRQNEGEADGRVLSISEAIWQAAMRSFGERQSQAGLEFDGGREEYNCTWHDRSRSCPSPEGGVCFTKVGSSQKITTTECASKQRQRFITVPGQLEGETSIQRPGNVKRRVRGGRREMALLPNSASSAPSAFSLRRSVAFEVLPAVVASFARTMPLVLNADFPDAQTRGRAREPIRSRSGERGDNQLSHFWPCEV